MAGGVLAAVVSGAFGVVLLAIVEVRDSASLARHSDEVLAAANHLEWLVIDLETGMRGFLMTGDERFLSPWTNAHAAVPPQALLFEHLAAARDAGQGRRAQQIGETAMMYIDGYSVPTVAAARRAVAAQGPVASRALPPFPNLSSVLDEGRRRIDDLRRQFDGFAAVEHSLAVARQSRADAAAGRATVAAAVGIAGSFLVVGLFTDYLTRTIVRPVRRAATMAGRLAAGDLAVRLPETGAAEVGALEQAFNTMGRSLQTSDRDLRRLLEEQAALRRVATLVARVVPPAELFEAVCREIAIVLDAPLTILLRGGAHDVASIAARWGELGRHLPVGHPYPLEEGDPALLVWRTGRAVRIESYANHSGPVIDKALRLGLRYGVAAPIVVGGRLWGLVGAAWTQPGRLPPGIEDRMTQFTELVATAIANGESRAQLSASRRRVVAAADETRRRIERDLHDGTQQRLVSVALDLRAAEAAVPAELVALKDQLAHAASDLSDAADDLREISRGIHPAILSKGGLGAALKMLVRRSPVPVMLVASDERRLPDSVEVALYYVASEALTNVARHARASRVDITLEADESVVRLVVRDDGVGGAGPERGSGLIGLRDRIEALGGTFGITSPGGEGTTLLVEIRLAER